VRRQQFADIVKLYIKDKLGGETENLPAFSSLVKSKFKQLQTTGLEAGLYFIIFMNWIFSRMAF